MMLVAGVHVPLANLATLAIRLRHLGETELSVRVSLAIDMNRSELKLNAYQQARLLQALGDGPDVFDELRAALTRRPAKPIRARAEATALDPDATS
jgi:hypothetical protein